MTRVLRRLRAAARASHRAGSSLARKTRRARWRPSASWTEGEAPASAPMGRRARAERPWVATWRRLGRARGRPQRARCFRARLEPTLELGSALRHARGDRARELETMGEVSRRARLLGGGGDRRVARASPPPVDDDRARDSPAATSRDAIHARSVLSTNATSADAIVRPRGAVEWEKMTNSARALSPPTTSTLRRTATRKCSANLTVYRRSNRPYLGSAPRFFREADGGSRTSRVPLVTSRRWRRAGRAPWGVGRRLDDDVRGRGMGGDDFRPERRRGGLRRASRGRRATVEERPIATPPPRPRDPPRASFSTLASSARSAPRAHLAGPCTSPPRS